MVNEYLEWLKQITGGPAVARYQYACTNLECEYEVEITHSVHDTGTDHMCPACGAHLHRVIQTWAIYLKGDGFNTRGAR